MTALPKRAVSKRPAHHDGMDQTLEYSKGERPNSAKRTRLDSTSDTRRKTEVYRNVTDSSNVVEQSSSDTKHTINGSVMGHAVDPYAPGRRKVSIVAERYRMLVNLFLFDVLLTCTGISSYCLTFQLQ
jgi:hypothetical protein